MAGETNQGSQRLHDLRLKASKKLAEIRHRSGLRDISTSLDIETHEALSDIDEDPAFNPGKVEEKLDEHHDAASSRALGADSKFQRAIAAVVHPKRTAKLKISKETAKTLAPTSHSKPTDKDHTDIIDAQEGVDRARERMTIDPESGRDFENAIDKYKDKVVALEEHRDKMLAGWATTRVNRVKVVQHGRFAWPDWRAYMSVDEKSGSRHFNFLPYIGRVLLYGYQDIGAQHMDDFEQKPFEVSVLRSHVERLAVLSAPWQAWFMDVRHVYRWEDPARTLRWLAVYVFLWYTQHMIAFLVAAMMWVVLKGRFEQVSADSIRQSMQRATDSESTAWRLDELLEKSDSDDLLNELGKTVGPTVQLQLGDLADALEIMANFRNWKSPTHTLATLFLLFVNLLICFTNWELSARYLYALLGFFFFFTRPISSRYPKYRHLVSPVRFLLWNNPTHAEWALEYLRRRALGWQSKIAEHDRQEEEEAEEMVDAVENQGDDPGAVAPPSPVDISNRRVMSFHADLDGKHGRLIITFTDLRLEDVKSHRLLWRLPYDRILEMRKLDRLIESSIRKMTRQNAVSSGDLLQLVAVNNEMTTVRLPRDRDECFNCILGFSGLQWQVMQGGAGTAAG